MMTPKEAWELVKAKMKNVDVETAYELEKLYVFSIRPAGSKSGGITCSTVIVVDKVSGKLEGLSTNDPRLTSGSMFNMIEPTSL